MQLSIVMPAYNEEETIEAVLRRVHDLDLGAIEKEIIVVDDGSTDRTPDILKALPFIRAITHARNSGKGAALTSGFQVASGDLVLIQDADLEYDPADYAALIQPIMEGRCDVVMGSRFLRQKPVFFGKNASPYLLHYLGNRLIIWITNLLYGHRFTDYEGGYKAFRRSVLVSTPVKAKGFEFDNELICKLLRKEVPVLEVPIRYTPRTYDHGKKITWNHGLIILWTIFKWRVRTV